MLFVFVIFPVAEIKYPDKGSLKGERISFEPQFKSVTCHRGRSWKGLVAASQDRKQRRMSKPGSFLLCLPSCTHSSPGNGPLLGWFSPRWINTVPGRCSCLLGILILAICVCVRVLVYVSVCVCWYALVCWCRCWYMLVLYMCTCLCVTVHIHACTRRGQKAGQLPFSIALHRIFETRLPAKLPGLARLVYQQVLGSPCPYFPGSRIPDPSVCGTAHWLLNTCAGDQTLVLTFSQVQQALCQWSHLLDPTPTDLHKEHTDYLPTYTRMGHILCNIYQVTDISLRF